MWVSTGTHDIFNCSEGLSSFWFVDALGMVDLFQQGPGLFQFLSSILVGGWVKTEMLAAWSIQANIATSPFGTFGCLLEDMLYTGCIN